ncbi:hypothetical protein [Anabaena lutea]|uniref:Rho termination factor N-terminal domain-containing protein n=1 Tax=Anabaena lutea FACHB-196 TaxID=2692881 RepID=A0ABR8F876_9NOST|nr:hypothetical protein [Anabaena lutea]MBD2566412.1 hypothetical protein [Anabaena lutea FACHB-196]
MLLQSRIITVNSEIDFIQEQITALQTKLTDLQSFSQQLQSVDQATDSALNQLSSAVALINAVCPEELSTFKAAIDALMQGDRLRLAATVENEDSPVTPEPVEPTPEVTVDVDPTHAGEQPEETPEASENHNGNGNGKGHHKTDSDSFVMLATIEELKACERPRLIKLANKYQIPGYQNKTRDKLAELLAGKVTVDEITPVGGKGSK